MYEQSVDSSWTWSDFGPEDTVFTKNSCHFRHPAPNNFIEMPEMFLGTNIDEHCVMFRHSSFFYHGDAGQESQPIPNIITGFKKKKVTPANWPKASTPENTGTSTHNNFQNPHTVCKLNLLRVKCTTFHICLTFMSKDALIIENNIAHAHIIHQYYAFILMLPIVSHMLGINTKN